MTDFHWNMEIFLLPAILNLYCLLTDFFWVIIWILSIFSTLGPYSVPGCAHFQNLSFLWSFDKNLPIFCDPTNFRQLDFPVNFFSFFPIQPLFNLGIQKGEKKYNHMHGNNKPPSRFVRKWWMLENWQFFTKFHRLV